MINTDELIPPEMSETDENTPISITPELLTRRKKKPAEWDELKLPQLPCKPGDTVTKDIALQWIEKIENDAAKERVICYTYRLFPVIDRNPSYIEKPFLSEWSENKFIRMNGGGEYKIMMTIHGTKEKVFSFPYEVNINTYDPILDYRELVLTDKKNQSWINAMKRQGRIKIDEETGEIIDVKKESKMQSAATDNKTIIDGISSAYTNSFAIAKEIAQLSKPAAKDGSEFTAIASVMMEQMKQNNTTDQLSKLMGALSPLIVKPERNGPDPMITMLMEETKALREQNTQLLTRIIDSKATDPFSTITKAMEFIDAIKGNNGADEQPKTTFDKLIDAFGRVAPAFLPMLTQQQQPQLQQQPEQIFTPVSNTNQLPPTPINSVMPQSPDDPTKQLAMMLNNPMVANMIASKIREGQKGYEFAEWIEAGWGKSLWAEVSNYTPQQIVAGMNANQGFRKMIAAFNDEFLTNWVTEFLNYTEIIEKLGREENDNDQTLA